MILENKIIVNRIIVNRGIKCAVLSLVQSAMRANRSVRFMDKKVKFQ